MWYRFCHHLHKTQGQALPGAGWVAGLELPAWPELRGVHPLAGKGDKGLLQVGNSHSGEEKKMSSCMLVHSILWQCLSHFTAYIWTSSPHHINKTRYIYFPVPYINNPLAKIYTHPLKHIANYIWFPLEVLLLKFDFWHSLFSWCKHVNSVNVKKFIDFNSWDGENI